MDFSIEDFGKRLKAERKKKDLSQEKLSHLTGISVQTLSSYETGQSAPVADYLFMIGLVLNTSIDYLLYGNSVNTNLINDEVISDTKGFIKKILNLLDTGLVTLDILDTAFIPKRVELKINDSDMVKLIEGIKKYVDDKDNLDSTTYHLVINSYLENTNTKI